MTEGQAATPLAPSRRALLGAAAALIICRPAHAADRSELEQDARIALQRLYASEPKAYELGQKAVAVLVFPKIVKAGFMIGGQTGNGVLFQGSRAVGYYNITAGSFGFQAGVQSFSYALFFMTEEALRYLDKSEGWAVGSGPSFVVVDKGKAKTINTTTITQEVFAMPFGQKGLMGGLGLEGSKITRIEPEA